MLVGCASAEEAPDCESPGEFPLQRVVDRSERLFVVAGRETVSDLSAMKKLLEQAREYISRCRPGWSSEWSVSVFSEAKYVGYKDEPAIVEFHKDGSWSRAYLAEYDHEKGVLTRYPLLPEQVVYDPLRLN
jgi:hypothetical protein